MSDEGRNLLGAGPRPLMPSGGKSALALTDDGRARIPMLPARALAPSLSLQTTPDVAGCNLRSAALSCDRVHGERGPKKLTRATVDCCPENE